MHQRKEEERISAQVPNISSARAPTGLDTSPGMVHRKTGGQGVRGRQRSTLTLSRDTANHRCRSPIRAPLAPASLQSHTLPPACATRAIVGHVGAQGTECIACSRRLPPLRHAGSQQRPGCSHKKPGPFSNGCSGACVRGIGLPDCSPRCSQARSTPFEL